MECRLLMTLIKECNSFYGDLYTSKQTKITGNLEKMFFGQEHPNLNEVDRDKCEGLLTEKECLEAVKSIESEIAVLERQFESSTNNDKEVLAEQLRVKKIELENIIEYKTKGAIIRSKARWYNEGEKNNKYFLNLENRHCKKKTIMQIKTKDGVSLTNDPDKRM